MNNMTPLVPKTSRLDQMFPTLTPVQLARIAAHGRARQVQRGEVLVNAGEPITRFFVVVAGQIEIMRLSGTTSELVAVCRPGMFTGEVNLLSGRRALCPNPRGRSGRSDRS